MFITSVYPSAGTFSYGLNLGCSGFKGFDRDDLMGTVIMRPRRNPGFIVYYMMARVCWRYHGRRDRARRLEL